MRSYLALSHSRCLSSEVSENDLLFTKALDRVLNSSLTADIQLMMIHKMATAINELIHRQILEISFQHTMGMNWMDWEDIAAQKTGALFRLIFEGTLLMNGVDILKCSDDLLDATGYKEGRQKRNDILE